MNSKVQGRERIERYLLRQSMRVLFRPVFGWRNPEARAFSSFTISGVDGSLLEAASYEADPAAAKGVILLCHPFLKYGMDYFFKNNLHLWLADAGYHVVAFNFKGFGRSTLGGASFMDDVISAGLCAKKAYPGLALHLYGFSFGGYHAIHAMARPFPLFSSAIFDSVPPTIASYFTSGPVGIAMRWFARSRWAGVTGTKSVLESLEHIATTPSLFLYGANDRFISAEAVQKIKTCPMAGAVLFEDCGHLEIRKRHPESYIEKVIGFVNKNNRQARAEIAVAAEGIYERLA